MSTSSSPVYGAAVPAQQPGAALPFRRRSLFVGLGITLIILAAILFVLTLISYLSILSLYSTSEPFSIPQALYFLNPLVLFFILAVLAVYGIMLILEGVHLRRMGVIGSWCIMTGIGDLLLAGAAFFGMLSSLLSLNYSVMIELFDYNFEFLDLFFTILSVPVLLLCIGAGVLYVMGALAQKRINKLNILLLIAGVAFVAFPLLDVVLEIASPAVEPTLFYIGSIISGVIMFAGRAFRGLAPLSYPKVIYPPSGGYGMV